MTQGTSKTPDCPGGGRQSRKRTKRTVKQIKERGEVRMESRKRAEKRWLEGLPIHEFGHTTLSLKPYTTG